MAATPSGIVTTSLNYFLEPEDGGDRIFKAGTVGEKRRKYLPAEVHINDIRGREDDFTLDKHGFQLVTKNFTEETFDDDERIRAQYYPEIVDLLKECTGASKVNVMSHVVRRRSWKSVFEAEKDLPDEARSAGPSNAKFVHCDQSFDGARQRVADLFPDDVEKTEQCRWGIINVWKPFDYPVTRDGLCFADAASIRDDEVRDLTIWPAPRRDSHDHDRMIQPVSVSSWQCAAPQTPDQHKWYYASEMKPDEALLLKMADSKRGVANKLMHSSFSSESDYGPDRHSLEVRCIVFWEDQPVN